MYGYDTKIDMLMYPQYIYLLKSSRYNFQGLNIYYNIIVLNGIKCNWRIGSDAWLELTTSWQDGRRTLTHH